MADQILKDKNNKILGKIKQLSNGQLEIYDYKNKRLGKYDPKTDQTRNSSNSLVGKGNLLTLLLVQK
jgi:hypothetical protein